MSTQDSPSPSAFQLAIRGFKGFELYHLERQYRDVLKNLDSTTPNYLETIEAIGTCIQHITLEQTIKANGPFEMWGGAFIPTSEAADVNNPPKIIRMNGQDVKVEYDAVRDRIQEIREASESDTIE